jgi:hypothetical protein
MKRIITTLAAIVSSTITLLAQTISQQEAMERALRYLDNSRPTAAARSMTAALSNGSTRFTPAPVEATSVYAFNREGGGFIIVSADSRTLPVLGYSTTGSISWNKMPPNMRAWLKQYDEATATLGDRTNLTDGNVVGPDGQPLSTARADWAPIPPLITSCWGQDAPYWGMTPYYEGGNPTLQGGQCLTGCTATSMAQVMNYYKWPKELPNGLPGYYCRTSSYQDVKDGWPIDALPPVTFDWDNMLDIYRVYNPETDQKDVVGNETQHRAVATLMRYCGQAAESMYSPDFTGSTSELACKAFNDYLDYPAAVHLARTQQYTIDEWEGIIYSELEAGRPVQYAASSNDGGHSFICDGYDTDGLFHMNWGWDGEFDGFFSLSVLNPREDQGDASILFNVNQRAIIHLDPAMEPQPVPEGSLAVSPPLCQNKDMAIENRNTVKFFFLYDGQDAAVTGEDNTFKAAADNALGTIGDDGVPTPRFMGDPTDTIIFKANVLSVEIDSAAFQPGDSLTLYPMLRFHKPGAVWQTVPPLTSHVVAGRTDEGRFFITTHGHPLWMTCSGITISKGTGRLGNSTDLTVTVSNHSESEFSGFLTLVPRYYGHIDPADITPETPHSKGKGMFSGVFLKGGQQAEADFNFVPQLGGIILFYLYANGIFISDTLCLNLTDDMIDIYDPYLQNNSHPAFEDGQWVYNVELADRPGTGMPFWRPATGIYLELACKYESEPSQYTSIDVTNYLTALPWHCGSGNYKFTQQLPLSVSREGSYLAVSYMMHWLDETQTRYHTSTWSTRDTIHVDHSAGITDLQATRPATAHPYYDLQGRPLDGLPRQKGLYIRQGRKQLVR